MVAVARRGYANAALGLILAVALAWRLNNIGFGLPSLYDPDEPMFMITALKLLKEGTLNPGWFGHPGSTTLYLLALIDVGIVASALLTGRFQTTDQFAAAAYADPGLVLIPSRVAMALLGVACVWLTYLVGRRFRGTSVGLIAAALLAINSLHISWSQVVRTDIHASVFLLACVLFSLRIAKHGRLRDYLIAGALLGFATATKWPAASVFVAIVGATAYRLRAPAEVERRDIRNLGAAALAAIGGLFIASPYIFLDWQTVLANVSGEVKSGHLAHTGGSFLENLYWYLRQVGLAMGLPGLALVVIGTALSLVRSPMARWVVVPAAFAFLALICSQGIIWSRWVLPVVPLFCIFAAIALVSLAEVLGRRLPKWPQRLVLPILAALIAIPSLAGAVVQSKERASDTRAQAADWAVANIAPGNTVVLEHLELKLRKRPWKFLFPIGQAGCLDGLKLLQTEVRYEEVQELRKGSPIVDLGNVSPLRLDSCKADYAILTYYDLYRAEADRYPAEVRNYDTLLAGGRTVALFRPHAGKTGGPVVRIVAFAQQ